MTGGVPKTKARRGTGSGVVTASLIAALLATWGVASTNSAAPASTASPEAASLLLARQVATRVRVTEKEFSIALDRTRFRPGKYTFTIQNKGQHPHDLKINGPGVRSKASRLIAAGQVGSLTVTLRKGSYMLWCTVPGHKVAGMRTTIRVR